MPNCAVFAAKGSHYSHGPDGWHRWNSTRKEWMPWNAIFVPAEALRATVNLQREEANAKA